MVTCAWLSGRVGLVFLSIAAFSAFAAQYQVNVLTSHQDGSGYYANYQIDDTPNTIAAPRSGSLPFNGVPADKPLRRPRIVSSADGSVICFISRNETLQNQVV